MSTDDYTKGASDYWRDFSEGVDVHAATASELFGVPVDEVSSKQRRFAKIINFGRIYGMNTKALPQSYVETVFGRRPEINSPNRHKAGKGGA